MDTRRPHGTERPPVARNGVTALVGVVLPGVFSAARAMSDLGVLTGTFVLPFPVARTSTAALAGRRSPA